MQLQYHFIPPWKLPVFRERQNSNTHFYNKIMIPSTITYKFGRCDIASRHPNVLYLLYLGSVNDQRKYLSLFFIRNDSRCCAAGKHVPSKNKDVKFFVKTLPQRLTKNISLTSMHFLLVPRVTALLDTW